MQGPIDCYLADNRAELDAVSASSCGGDESGLGRIDRPMIRRDRTKPGPTAAETGTWQFGKTVEQQFRQSEVGALLVDFLGSKPGQIGHHYREADPMQLSLPQITRQWLIHGGEDDVAPSILSRNYTEQRKKRGEDAHYLEISTAGHFDLIDPRSKAWPKVENTALHELE
jgi:hypothetical protein